MKKLGSLYTRLSAIAIGMPVVILILQIYVGSAFLRTVAQCSFAVVPLVAAGLSYFVIRQSHGITSAIMGV